MSKSGLVPIRKELLQLTPVKVLVFASDFLIFSAGMIISDLSPDLKLSLNSSAIHWPNALLAGFLFAGAMLVVQRPSPKVSDGQPNVV